MCVEIQQGCYYIIFLNYMSACGKIRFELHDITKHGVPIFKQVSDL